MSKEFVLEPESEKPDLVRLDLSVLCLDCERISESRHSCCVGCGSVSLMALSPILNRGIRPEAVGC